MDAYNQILRRRLRESTARLPKTEGEVYRGATKLGDADGYKYVKSRSGFTISLAGQAADQPDGEYLMALYPDELPAAQEGDVYKVGDARYRILAIRDATAYQTYRLEAIP